MEPISIIPPAAMRVQSAPDTASGGRASAPDGTMKHRPQTPSYH